MQPPQQGLSNQSAAVEEPQQINQHERSNGVLFQIMKHVIPESTPASPRRINLQLLVLLGPGCFIDGKLGFEQYWTQWIAFFTIKRLMMDEHSEKPGEAVGVIGPLSLDMTAERFGPHVDATNELGARTRFDPNLFVAMSRQPGDQPFSIVCFVGLQPHRAVMILRKRIQPPKQRGDAGIGKLMYFCRSQFEKLRQAEDAPSVAANGFRLRVHGMGVRTSELSIFIEMLPPVGLDCR